jgi:uncharacterized membrane protein (DUF373 family)
VAVVVVHVGAYPMARRAPTGQTRVMADDGAPANQLTRLLDRVIARCEDVLYAAVSLVLVVGAVIVLVEAGHALATEADEGVRKAIEHSLDSLLIVFILIELLSAVRATIAERRLVAEPFLLIGIIASIKEIVVTTVFAEPGVDVQDTMLVAGVLGLVILGLSAASLLLRRKEREPSE